MGGLGIRNVVQLAPSAFLASAAASSDLVQQIVPPALQGCPLINVEAAEAQWSVGLSNAPPEGADKCKQKSWGSIKASNTAEGLLADAPDPRARAHFQSEGDGYLARCAAYFFARPKDG